MFLLITNANINTMDKTRPHAEAAVIIGSKFAFVGDNASAREFAERSAPGAEEYDCGGAFLMPGFNDSHMHLLSYVLGKRSIDLSGARSIDKLIERMREAIPNLGLTPGQWLVGMGWNQDDFEDEKRFPAIADLDMISTEIPIVITRACFHAAVINTKAMELLELDEQSAERYGEYAARWREGIFVESGMEAIGAAFASPPPGECLKLMLESQEEFFERGITSIQSNDFCVNDFRAGDDDESWQLMESLRKAGEDGRLKLRISGQITASDPETLDAAFGRGLRGRGLRGRGLDGNYGNPHFCMNAIKLFTDGSLGARTAYLNAPYADDPSTRGLMVLSPENVTRIVEISHQNGMPVAIHAIGDAAIDMCLDAIEAAQNTLPLPLRHGIVHSQITSEAQLERMKRLGVIVYTQPIFLDYDLRIVNARVGEALAATSYAFKDYIDMGIPQSFGTDCPVEPFFPLECLYCAITRKTLHGEGPYREDQALCAANALRAYTTEGAYASGEEDVKGMIREGMLADFVVFDRDLTAFAPEEMLGAKVLRTYVDGVQVFGQGSAEA